MVIINFVIIITVMDINRNCTSAWIRQKLFRKVANISPWAFRLSAQTLPTNKIIYELTNKYKTNNVNNIFYNVISEESSGLNFLRINGLQHYFNHRPLSIKRHGHSFYYISILC